MYRLNKLKLSLWKNSLLSGSCCLVCKTFECSASVACQHALGQLRSDDIIESVIAVTHTVFSLANYLFGDGIIESVIAGNTRCAFLVIYLLIRLPSRTWQKAIRSYAVTDAILTQRRSSNRVHFRKQYQTTARMSAHKIEWNYAANVMAKIVKLVMNYIIIIVVFS